MEVTWNDMNLGLESLVSQGHSLCNVPKSQKKCSRPTLNASIWLLKKVKIGPRLGPLISTGENWHDPSHPLSLVDSLSALVGALCSNEKKNEICWVFFNLWINSWVSKFE